MKLRLDFAFIVLATNLFFNWVVCQFFEDELVEAARTGNVFQITHYLNEGVNANIRNNKGNTPLIVAVANNQIDAARLLLNRGSFINAENEAGETALTVAVKLNNFGITAALIKAGADINGGTETSPLLAAAQANRTEMAQLLLDNGANIQRADIHGTAAISCAAGNGNIEMVKICLDAGAHVDHRGPKKTTPLMYAAGYNHLEVAKYLIAQGATVNIVNEDGNSPLMFSTFPKGSTTLMAKTLLDNGAVVDAPNANGVTPLMMASYKGDIGTVKLLVKRGADPKHESDTGETASELAIKRGFYNIAEFFEPKQAINQLLVMATKARSKLRTSHPPSISTDPPSTVLTQATRVTTVIETTPDTTAITTSTTSTPLSATSTETSAHITCQAPAIANGVVTVGDNFVQQVKEIEIGQYVTLACNADYFLSGPSIIFCSDVGTWRGRLGTCLPKTLTRSSSTFTSRPASTKTATTQELATDAAITAVTSKIKTEGDISTPFLISGTNQSTSQKYADTTSTLTNSSDEIKGDPCKAMLRAVKVDQLDVLKMVLPSCSNIDYADQDGWSPLIWAANGGYDEIVDYLLTKGAKVNTANVGGSTALLFAAKNGHHKTAQLLLHAGADPSRKNVYGTTPLAFAASSGFVDIVKLLLDNGAKVDDPDNSEQTALIWAVKSESLDAAKLLLEHGANPDHQDKGGVTALMVAARSGYKDIAKALLHASANKALQDSESLTAEAWAFASNHDDTATLINHFTMTKSYDEESDYSFL